MRLVAWNCAMALHRKFDDLLRLKPDVAVISETASPDILKSKMGLLYPDCEAVWIGNNANKGIAVFAFNGINCEIDPSYTDKHKYIAPVSVTGAARTHILAVWAQNNSDNQRRKHIPGPFREAIETYRPFLSKPDTLVMGDFNNNVIWDRPNWLMNHAEAVHELKRLGLESVYHASTGEEQGCETTPTHFWRDRKKDCSTFHIDFIFASHRQLRQPYNFHVGSFEDWCGNGLSDHVPLVLDIDLG